MPAVIPPLPLNWPNRVDLLPLTLDRFRATAVFFDVKLPFFLAGSLSALRWVSWGALTALASIPEVLERELATLGLIEEWRASAYPAAIRKDPLLVVMRELRNYETHLSFLERREKSPLPSHQLAHDPGIRASYFAPISFETLSELKNIRERRSHVTQQTVLMFNQLAERHTVEGMVDLALDRLSSIIHEFLDSVGWLHNVAPAPNNSSPP